MTYSMKLLSVLVLGTALAAPALAQQAPNARRNAAAAAAAEMLHYQRPHQWQNNNTNPDFQLGGER